MDYARKIGKTEKPRKWERRSLVVSTIADDMISKNEDISEDRRLVNWKKWLADRKRQYRLIKSATGRRPTDQLINSCEKIRPIVEMRDLMDYANVPVPIIPDKYRGGPEFWRTPQFLSNSRDSCLPELSITPSKKDLNIPPELEYISLTKITEKEKDLVGLKCRSYSLERSDYLKKRKVELAREIQEILPKEPETEELEIKGYRFEKIEKKNLRIPPITVTSPEEEEPSENSDQVVVLKIQDREFIREKSFLKTDQPDPSPVSWSLIFTGEIHKIKEKQIVFENKGTRVIVYHWRDASFRFPFIKFQRSISPFYFNKTKGIILPGQIVNLKIWYRPRNPGVSTESWRLETDPRIIASPLIFRFWGCAEDDSKVSKKIDKSREIDEYLNRCVRDSVVQEIIEEIMGNIDYTKPLEPAYNTLFLEGEIFRHKNPLCHYRPSLSMEFRKIYKNINENSNRCWSLSLEELKTIITEIKQFDYREDLLKKFNDLYKESLKPCLFTPIGNYKHEMVYIILCSFVNLFEVESEYVKNNCLTKEGKRNPSNTNIPKSQTSSKVNNSRNNKRGRKTSSRTSTLSLQENEHEFSAKEDNQLYREIFFVRIYMALTNTVERISASIDSLNRLNERDQ